MRCLQRTNEQLLIVIFSMLLSTKSWFSLIAGHVLRRFHCYHMHAASQVLKSEPLFLPSSLEKKTTYLQSTIVRTKLNIPSIFHHSQVETLNTILIIIAGIEIEHFGSYI